MAVLLEVTNDLTSPAEDPTPDEPVVEIVPEGNCPPDSPCAVCCCFDPFVHTVEKAVGWPGVDKEATR